MPVTGDLAQLAREARARRLPLLLLFSQSECPWCERARREYLSGLSVDPAAAGRVIVRQVDLDSDAALVDFDGRATSHRAFARAQRVAVAPTVMFFGPAGERLAEPIVGMRIADFYGAYIERAIDEGLAKLR